MTGDAQSDPLTLSIFRMAANSILGARRFTDRFARGLASDARNQRILEIGSGKASNGAYPKSYKDDFDSTNIFTQSDINPEYGHEIVDITRMEHEEKFDLILCLNVLEHVFHLEIAVRNLHRATKQSGLVAVIVPALYPLHDEPHDYWRPTEHGLRRLFSDFKDLEIRNSGLRKLPFMYSVLARK
ncbi:MAG: class I SAM-dependent methyltransferase [Hypericibacter sp.]